MTGVVHGGVRLECMQLSVLGIPTINLHTHTGTSSTSRCPVVNRSLRVSGEVRSAAGAARAGRRAATLAAASRRRPAMLRLWCCPRSPAVAPHPAPHHAPDLVADLPALTRDSSAVSAQKDRQHEKEYDKSEEDEKDERKSIGDLQPDDDVVGAHREDEEAPEARRSPSILIEDRSGRSPVRDHSVASASPRRSERFIDVDSLFGSTKSLRNDVTSPSTPRPVDRKSSPSPVDRGPTPSPTDGKSTSSARSRRSSPGSPLAKSDSRTPSPNSSLRSDARETSPIRCESVSPCTRDVRTALAECILPARHEDWEAIVSGLAETARLAADDSASAPPAVWRAAARAAAAHVRSLRSRVARAACTTLGVLFEHRGRVLDLELEEAASALLDRCADVNRFLRAADAGNALVRVACGGSGARATVALCRRGAAHRAGPVRAAAAQALAELVRASGATRTLDLPPEPRTVLLRAAAELLGDATPEARAHARRLCLALAEDHRFRPLLKESMPPARYRAVEKNVDKLRCR
ncbi:TOG array regulator of axonemal microtubules protein 1 [Eumeta japonica]|uniref:TOG array regulator of axonemal microtubules protein 1 n=1 Tax=Eumeta variegata TaxID=151549 RepID=A0A4C1S8H9_EUMVA|nr:TOG array regulator of axonemal microtubules protein 1 [Eumeta japonica]